MTKLGMKLTDMKCLTAPPISNFRILVTALNFGFLSVSEHESQLGRPIGKALVGLKLSMSKVSLPPGLLSVNPYHTLYGISMSTQCNL